MDWPGNIFFLEYNFVFKFFFKILEILFLSKPPRRNIIGLLTKLIIVDSSPILQIPPSNIIGIFFPNSSLTSDALTGLRFEKILALGAAIG